MTCPVSFQPRYLHNHGDVVDHRTNQLLCFDTTSKEWMNPECFGSVPSPRTRQAVTKIDDTVWLYGGDNFPTSFDDLYELNMLSLTWTENSN